MKKVLTIALLAAIASQGKAAGDDNEYGFLMLTTTSGSQTTLAVDKLELTVSGSQLVATNVAGTRSFKLSDLATMQFTNSGIATAIDAADTALSAGVDIFSLSGTSLGHYSSMAECRAKLGKGIYIARQSGKTTKIQVR